MMQSSHNESANSTELEASLMEWDEYSKLSISLPYHYEIATSRGVLFYYGCSHFSSTDHPEFTYLQECVDEFRPSAIVVEATDELTRFAAPEQRSALLEQIQRYSKEEAVTFSERYLGIKLALERKVHIESAEMLLTEQFKKLSDDGYDPVQILGYFMFRAIGMWPLYREKWTLEKFIDWRLDTLNRNSPWSPVVTWPEIEEFGRSLLPNFNLVEPEQFRERVNPTLNSKNPNYTILNEISRRNTRHRDCHIMLETIRCCDQFDRVFVIFGASHAVLQERALKRHFNSFARE